MRYTTLSAASRITNVMKKKTHSEQRVDGGVTRFQERENSVHTGHASGVGPPVSGNGPATVE